MNLGGSALFRFSRSYLTSGIGASAAEFALVLPFLIIPLLNAIDVGVYAYDRMMLDNAAQSAVQAAWATCTGSTTTLPATQNCSGLSAATTTAAHSTALKSNVSITSTVENYCCPNNNTNNNALDCSGSAATASTKLYKWSSASTPPSSNCDASNNVPGDYIMITTSYTYAPIFSAISVASLLTTPITRTAYMRLQ